MSEYIIWNELGNVYIKMGAIDDAISAYLKAIEMNPGYGWPYSNMAYAHVQKGDYEEAVRLYKKSIELLFVNKDKAISWNRLGDTYRYLQDYNNAMNAYQTADQLSKDPDQTSDDFSTVLLFPDAILAEEVIGIPTDANIPSEHPLESGDGSSKELNDLFDRHENISEDIPFGIPPDDTEKQDDLFTLDDNGTEIQSAHLSEWLRDLLKLDAQKETQSLGMGSWSTRKETSHASRTVETRPNEYGSSGSNDIPAFQPRVNLSPAIGDANPVVLELEAPMQPGLFVIEPGHEDHVDTEQEATFSKQSDRNIQQPAIVIPPAPNQNQPLDPVIAEIKKYEKIVCLNETNDRAWDTLGKLYKSLGRYDEAIKAFERAIALAPHHEAYHYNLGLVFTIQNRYLDAIESFQNAIALNDQYILAHGALAGCYRRLGKHEEATDHIKLAMPMMADESKYNRACFNVICGNNDQAIELLKTALMKQEVSLGWVLSDPDLEGIRDDSRYQALVKEAQCALVDE